VQSLTSAEKSALTKFEASLANPATRRRETLALQVRGHLNLVQLLASKAIFKLRVKAEKMF
jgi:hypothetical protein